MTAFPTSPASLDLALRVLRGLLVIIGLAAACGIGAYAGVVMYAIYLLVSWR
jgi:hypothetical protein